jgi:hypothetical protein
VVTLSLMILLTVVAVGLLTLSTISLRTSGQGDAMAKARSNARLALMLAIGELQKSAGPDKAITATSGIMDDSPGKPNLTGVWESWDYSPNSSSLDYDGEKDRRFRSWLVSDPDIASTASRAYANAPYTGDTVELVGSNSLGGSTNSNEKVEAGRVGINVAGKKVGSYAWHVADESVKARINSYRDPSRNSTIAQRRSLLAGHRPDLTVMSVNSKSLSFLPTDSTVTNYKKAMAASGKLVSLNQADLMATTPVVGNFRNHVTPYSLGLMTNVRRGGLKQDLTTIFERGATSLPSEFNGRKIYQSTLGLSGVSDPYWSCLASYYNMYKEVLAPNTDPYIYKRPTSSVTLTTLAPPTQFTPAPVLAKVESIFSFVVRDAHNNWLPTLTGQDPQKRYMGHLVYSPVITLHNPYNVSLRFDSLKVSLANIPIAFSFFVNGQPQNSSPTPLGTMFIAKKGEKTFVMNIGNWTNAAATDTSRTGPIVMLPGQTLVCGPYMAAGALWDSAFDWQNNMTGTSTAPMKAKPGFVSHSVGFGVDWLTPPEYGTPTTTDNNIGVLGLKLTDTVAIQTNVIQPPYGTTSRVQFDVETRLTVNGVEQNAGGMSFQYQNQTNLSKLFPKPMRYPRTGVGHIASDMYHPNSVALASQSKARAVVLFSTYGRTANGGVYETGERTQKAGALNELADGRLAGKPFLHHNQARPVITINLANEKPGIQSHEMNFQPLPGDTIDYFSTAADNRATYLLTHKQAALRSIKSGSYLEIPTGPMQTIADFRRSNAFTSSYLPTFTQPVGNSYASPLMSTNSVIQSGVVSYQLLDHSVLANHALYDRFYFSTFTGANETSADKVFTSFMEDNVPLQSQIFQPYLPTDETVDSAKSKMFDSSAKPTSEAYLNAAKYQMVKGPFNVNSTSVEAWKAQLSSMRDSEVPVLWVKKGPNNSSPPLDIYPTAGIPLLAMSLHNGGRTDGTADLSRVDDVIGNHWGGYREVSNSKIELLAQKIVEQVRARGPFLSMSEFVNRRIGSDSDMTQKGALQQAIDEAELNDAVLVNQRPVSLSNLTDTTLYNYKNPAAQVGNPAAGAPGWISQGDLLRILEPAATVRSDTFVIRTCGEATDTKGNVVARAYVEAVVQRVPEFLDSKDSSSTNVYEVASASNVNKVFGRRLALVSFRWLSANEI